MIAPKIYLSGPISNYHYNEINLWREYVASSLHPYVQCLSPMRDTEHLKDAVVKETNHNHDEILARDYFDCQRADLLFVNLLGATHVSIGTVSEIAWCKVWQKPVLLVMEKEGNCHEHGFIRKMCSWHVTSLEDGIRKVRQILCLGD